MLALGSESGLEFKPSLPRLDFQTAGAVSVLKAMACKLLLQSPVQAGPGNASLSISSGVGRDSAKQPHTGENSFPLVLERLGEQDRKDPTGFCSWQATERSCQDPEQDFRSVSSPCDVSAVQGLLCLWEASLRADFSWSIPAWSVD